MAIEKRLNSRVILKHDIEENWNKATGFIPEKGEIIIYDRDTTHNYVRVKVGDGVTAVPTLGFTFDNFVTVQTLEEVLQYFVQVDGDKVLSDNNFTDAEKEKLAGIADGAEANVQADWNETNTSSDAYIKNKPTVGSGIGFDNNKIINTGVRAVSTGVTSGTIKVNTNGTEAEVPVAGLGSAAYTEAADYATAGDLSEVRSIAEGASQAISYSDYAALVEAFNGLAADKYKIGQNIMIVQLDVPDLWISSIEITSVNYSYTGDEEFTSVLKTTGSVQIGYYKLSALETHKIDLTEYLKIADANKKLEEAQQYTDNAVATKSAVQIITWEDGD